MGFCLVEVTLLVIAWPALRVSASLQVAPAVVEAPLEPGSTVGPVWVRNTGSQAAAVQVELVGLSHDPRGRPVFLTDPHFRGDIGRLLRPSWQSATVEAGEARPLHFQVTPAASGRASAYAAAWVQSAVPTGTLRVAVLLLLGDRVSGAGLQAEPSGVGRLEDGPLSVRAAWAEQRAAGAPVELVAEVFNGGAVHLRPRLLARVADERGRALGQALLGPALVLPGASRQLRGAWAPPLLPPGMYRVLLFTSEGATAGQPGPLFETAFQVAAPYQVALAQGRVGLALLGFDPSGRPALQAVVHNGGLGPVAPLLELQVASDSGPIAATTVRGPLIPPGEQGAVVLPWPDRADAGRPHTAVVRWVDGGRTVAEASLTVWAALASAEPKGSGRP